MRGKLYIHRNILYNNFVYTYAKLNFIELFIYHYFVYYIQLSYYFLHKYPNLPKPQKDIFLRLSIRFNLLWSLYIIIDNFWQENDRTPSIPSWKQSIISYSFIWRILRLNYFLWRIIIYQNTLINKYVKVKLICLIREEENIYIFLEKKKINKGS